MTAPILSSPLSILLDHLWKLSGPDAATPAIRVNLGNGFLTKFHERYPDAPHSPLYVNLRTKDNPKPGPLGPDEVGRVALVFHELMQTHHIRPTWMCGIPNAGEPLGKALSRIVHIQHLQLVKSPEGGRRRISGFASPVHPRFFVGDHVLLLDDVMSEADTKLEALALFEGEPIDLTLFVLLDRGQGGMEVLRRNLSRPCSVFPALTLGQFVAYSLQHGHLSTDMADACLAYPKQLAAFKAERGIS